MSERGYVALKVKNGWEIRDSSALRVARQAGEVLKQAAAWEPTRR